MKLTCVQCGEGLADYVMTILVAIGSDYGGSLLIPVCLNPACPNYGLLQLGKEKCQELLEGGG